MRPDSPTEQWVLPASLFRSQARHSNLLNIKQTGFFSWGGSQARREHGSEIFISSTCRTRVDGRLDLAGSGGGISLFDRELDLQHESGGNGQAGEDQSCLAFACTVLTCTSHDNHEQ